MSMSSQLQEMSVILFEQIRRTQNWRDLNRIEEIWTELKRAEQNWRELKTEQWTDLNYITEKNYRTEQTWTKLNRTEQN